jgi:hypothetical protein
VSLAGLPTGAEVWALVTLGPAERERTRILRRSGGAWQETCRLDVALHDVALAPDGGGHRGAWFVGDWTTALRLRHDTADADGRCQTG